MRLDQLLIDLGYFQDLRTARGWIMAGKVVVDQKVLTSSAAQVAIQAEVHVRGRPLRFVSRGGYKLERALLNFGISLEGKIVLDAGASTGGFTDCSLQAGARRVYSVEVGYGQLRGSLRLDPRVISLERTNISDLTYESFDLPIDVAVADLSYLTLRIALPVIRSLFDGPFETIALIKPLYEGLAQADLDNTAALFPVLLLLFEKLAEVDIGVAAVCVSPILGGHGAIEFLASFRSGFHLDVTAAASTAIDDLRKNPPRADTSGLD